MVLIQIKRFPLLIASIFVFLTYLDKAGGVNQCYVCSWQKPTSGKLDMMDNCTHYNFKPEYATTVNCTEGCEAISYRHSKDQDVYHFSRNCFNARKGFTKEDKCYAVEDKTEYLNVCECHSNLCNSAQSSFKVSYSSSVWGAIPFLFILMGSTLSSIKDSSYPFTF